MSATTTSSATNAVDAEQAEPAAKRAKLKNGDVLDILSPHILQDEARWKANYDAGKPYRHGVLENLFVDGFLEQVFEEVTRNTKVNFKESDLFRVYQSVDLGNLTDGDSIAETLPTLMRLKRAVYSNEFRHFVERLASLPPDTLTDEVDCAANCHDRGCHLLCHDDVIGTRKVSFIIYLTGKDWAEEEGGCLELYQSGEEGKVPAVFPAKTILPTFNSMAFFQVEPGMSFHSVQEVFGDRPRLSIQGWYHAAEAPPLMKDATLSRLKSTEQGEDTEGEFSKASWTSTENVAEELSEQDLAYLKNYVNDTYLKNASMKEIRTMFEEESSVQLRHFLQPQWLDQMNRAMQEQDKNLGRGRPPASYTVGVNQDWKAVGPAHKQRFLEYVGEAKDDGRDDDAGAVLRKIQKEVFESAPFGRFLKCLTSLETPLGYRGRVRRFRPGLDYTVAHYGILTKQPVLDATLCFAAGTGEQSQMDEETGEVTGSEDDALWDCGDCGGFECYIAADDEDEKQEAAAEYNTEDDTELLSVSASNNTLSLVYRDPGTMRFVKYVGCRAPSSRWDVCMEYEVEDTAEAENTQGEKEEVVADD